MGDFRHMAHLGRFSWSSVQFGWWTFGNLVHILRAVACVGGSGVPQAVIRQLDRGAPALWIGGRGELNRWTRCSLTPVPRGERRSSRNDHFGVVAGA